MRTIKGSCFCQAVKYSTDEVETMASICHCGFCRRLNGSDFTTWVSIPSDKFHISQGVDILSSFQAGEYNKVHFCSRCGTRVYSVDTRYPYSSVLRGTIISPLDIDVTKQWFLEDRVS